MGYDVFKSVSQGGDRTQDEENRRIEEIANELERLCQLYETQSGNRETNVNGAEIEFRVTERFADGDIYVIDAEISKNNL